MLAAITTLWIERSISSGAGDVSVARRCIDRQRGADTNLSVTTEVSSKDENDNILPVETPAMTALGIRDARPDERSTLEALQWRASLANPGDRQALLANTDAIVLPDDQIAAGHVFVAERDDHVVGFAAVLPREDRDTELDALFVEPAAWRQGIGQALVAHCAAIARARGSSALHVLGNPHAEAFYLSCGFRILGTEHTRFGVGYRMHKPLPRP